MSTPHDDAATSEPSDGDAGQDAAVLSCGEAYAKTTALFETYCASCHDGARVAEAPFDVLDRNMLVDSGLLIPDDPDNSPLYQRVAAGVMPPASESPRPQPEEIAALRSWIRCGAPSWGPRPSTGDEFPSVNERLTLMRDDLAALGSDEARRAARYVDLGALVLQGFSSRQLTEVREALVALLQAQRPGAPPPAIVDDKGILLRLRLSDYGFGVETWDALIATYPYGIRYAEDGASFSFNESAAEDLRVATGSVIPHVHGAWLFTHLPRPADYQDPLGTAAAILAKLAQPLDLRGAASLLGLSDEDLRQALETSPAPEPVIALLDPDGTIDHASFEMLFPALVKGIALGTAIDPEAAP